MGTLGDNTTLELRPEPLKVGRLLLFLYWVDVVWLVLLVVMILSRIGGRIVDLPRLHPELVGRWIRALVALVIWPPVVVACAAAWRWYLRRSGCWVLVEDGLKIVRFGRQDRLYTWDRIGLATWVRTGTEIGVAVGLKKWPWWLRVNGVHGEEAEEFVARIQRRIGPSKESREHEESLRWLRARAEGCELPKVRRLISVARRVTLMNKLLSVLAGVPFFGWMISGIPECIVWPLVGVWMGLIAFICVQGVLEVLPLRTIEVEGDQLLISNLGGSVVVPLRAVREVRQRGRKSRIVVLTLATPTPWGRRITFMPPMRTLRDRRLLPWDPPPRPDPVVQELQELVQAAGELQKSGRAG